MRGINDQDGHFLAGFIDAEGCFQITANNGGTAWVCALTLSQRDDDADLLVDLQARTGLGHLRHTPARHTSMPQITWRIQRRRDCLCLAELLERFPLRGRKRMEAEMWTRAVRELDRSSCPERLPQFASELRSLKRYVNLVGSPHAPPPLDEDLISYFGGFFTGEGHLQLSDGRCRVATRLRDDDRPLLEGLASATGLGKLYSAPRDGRTAPSVVWLIHRRDQLAPAVRLLERAGLRGRKAKEFAHWRVGALEFADALASQRRPRRSVISDAAAAVRTARRYRTGSPAPTPCHGERQAQRCVDSLRAAAEITPGPLTVTAYSAHRRANPHWPARNAVAKAFGSWSQALDAAGLGDRRARRQYSARPEPPHFTDQEVTQRHAQITRVASAVLRLADRHGRMPTVHEYLAWRTEHDRSLPYLSKVYDLFPGGWSSVTKLARGWAPARTPGVRPGAHR
jgi:hypothetical protein